jgi:hypothetical protein
MALELIGPRTVKVIGIQHLSIDGGRTGGAGNLLPPADGGRGAGSHRRDFRERPGW